LGFTNSISKKIRTKETKKEKKRYTKSIIKSINFANSIMNVSLFIPCFVNELFPNTAINTYKLLKKLNCNVQYNTAQTCCGQPAYNAGFWEDAKAVSEKYLHDFEGENYIVSPSGSCCGYVKNGIPELFNNTLSHNKAKNAAQRSFELTDFIVNILKIENVGARMHAKVCYHDACGALRECKIKSQPRLLLENVEGLELVEMRESETCCGFGGTFSIKYEPISVGMAQQKCAYAIETDAEYIVSTDISCLMHLQAYISKHNLPLKTMHIADVLMMNNY
jgi:L-lactate dehydrogenase complex protein LldE